MVESRCCERDAIAFLRSCLGTEPAKLVEGISSDLSAAWKYLHENYSDPRVVSDTVTADLERFRAIQPGEDHRFCDLVNLLRRPFNILKEVNGTPRCWQHPNNNLNWKKNVERRPQSLGAAHVPKETWTFNGKPAKLDGRGVNRSLTLGCRNTQEWPSVPFICSYCYIRQPWRGLRCSKPSWK